MQKDDWVVLTFKRTNKLALKIKEEGAKVIYWSFWVQIKGDLTIEVIKFNYWKW